jgi:hypothetical protein
MKPTLFHSIRKYGFLKKVTLAFFILIACLIVFLDVRWSYHAFESGMGTPMAQVAIAYHVLLLLGMIVAGVVLGHRLDQMMSQRRSIFHSPARGSWTETLMNLWGYEVKSEDQITEKINSVPSAEQDAADDMVLLDLPTRRGRKPTFPLERWLPITLQWENRDPIRDAFTLGELISEHLGTNPDGSPIVSEQTYYSTWRPRAIAELRRRADSKKSIRLHAAERRQS